MGTTGKTGDALYYNLHCVLITPPDFTTLLQFSPGLSVHVTIQHDPYQCRFWNRYKGLVAKLLDYILGKYPHLTFGTEKIPLPKKY